MSNHNELISRAAFQFSELALAMVEFQVAALMWLTRFLPLYNGSIERLAVSKASILEWRRDFLK